MKSASQRMTRDSVLARLMEDYLASCEAGLPLTAEELAGRYPELADEVATCVASLDFIRKAAASEPAAGHLPSAAQAQGQLGDYRIVREIGRGGMGVVYEAEQISLARRVALKVLPFAGVLDSNHLARFKNEALAAAQLDHPHIVDVLGVGCDRGTHFYAMRFIDGCTLADVVRELRVVAGFDPPVGNAHCGVPSVGQVSRLPSEGLGFGVQDSGIDRHDSRFPAPDTRSPAPDTRFPTPDTLPLDALSTFATFTTQQSLHSPEYFRSVAALFADAADALHHAHEQGIIHRDIKPSNLMLDSRGKLWITDFGLAHIETSVTLTATGDLLGTLRYMSPEQALGSRLGVDHRTDVYSLGATLYELLTLHPVFDGDQRAPLLHRLAHDAPKPPRLYDRSIPGELETIALKALEKGPSDRFSTADQLAQDLRRFLDNKPIRARRPGLAQVVKKWASRHAPLVILAAVASLVLASTLAVGAGLLWQERGHTRVALKTAEDNFQAAKTQQRQAEKYAEDVRVRLYAADMRLAFQSWNSADLRQTVDVLTRHLPTASQPDLRGFEWHYLWRLCHDERLVIAGHQGEVYWAAFSPDGVRLVTAGEDKTAKVWNAATGQEIFTLRGHTAAVRSAMYSPSGDAIVTASDDKTIKLWDATTGRLKTTLTGHSRELRCVAFSPDGRWLASGSLDDTAQLWDVDSHQVVAVFRGHSRGVRGVAFSPDGQTLATAAGDHLIKLWDVPTLQELRTLSGNITWLSGVAFSPDGNSLASSCWGPMIKLWDVASGRELCELAEHTNWVQSVAYSRDGKTLLSASRDTTVRLRDPCTAETTRVLRAHPGTVWCAAFSPDEQTIATAGADGLVKLWDDDAQQPYRKLSIDWPTKRDPIGGLSLLTASLSSGGRRLAYFTAHDRELRILDLVSGELERTTFGDTDDPAFKCMEISPDGHTAATGAASGLVQLWDVQSGQERHRLAGHPYYVHSLAFSSDGRWLASGDGAPSGEYQGSVRLWDVATAEQRLVLPCRGSGVRDLTFSPDSKLFAAVDEDRVRVWHVSDAELHCELIGHALGIGAVRFSPDGSLIATGSDDRTVRLWDAATGQLRFTMLGHAGNIASLAFSPDGRTLVSASHDQTIRLWHVATGQELAVLDGHTNGLAVVTFCLNGKSLACLGNQEILFWPTAGIARPGESKR